MQHTNIFYFAVLFRIQFKSRTSGAFYQHLKDFFLKLENNPGEETLLQMLQYMLDEKLIFSIGDKNDVMVEDNLFFIHKKGLRQYEELNVDLLPELGKLIGQNDDSKTTTT